MRAIGLDPATVHFIIVKARQLDAKDGATEEDGGSNPADDGFAEVLTDTPDDPSEHELTNLIDDMDVDQQERLVALAWVGRGDFDATEWADAVAQARQRHTGPTARYLLGMPLLADYLEEGLAALGLPGVGAAED